MLSYQDPLEPGGWLPTSRRPHARPNSPLTPSPPLAVAAVSVITDECDPDNLKPINIEEIISVAGKAELKLTELFSELIARI